MNRHRGRPTEPEDRRQHGYRQAARGDLDGPELAEMPTKQRSPVASSNRMLDAILSKVRKTSSGPTSYPTSRGGRRHRD